MMKGSAFESYGAIAGILYLGLMTNALLALTSAPLLIVVMTTDPAESWPLIAMTTPLCAPGVVGAFAAFASHAQGGASVVRTYFRAYARAWGRPVIVASLAVVLAVVVYIDLRVVAATTFQPAVAPLLCVVLVLVAATAAIALVAYAEEPAAQLRQILRASLYVGIRRWYFTLASLGVLVMQGFVFAAKPAIGMGITAAPALYLVWAGSRHSLDLVLAHHPGPIVGHPPQ